MKICFTLDLNTLFEVTSHKLVAVGLRPAPHGLLPLTCLTFGNHAVVPFDLFVHILCSSETCMRSDLFRLLHNGKRGSLPIYGSSKVSVERSKLLLHYLP